jgi:hypothetical protein
MGGCGRCDLFGTAVGLAGSSRGRIGKTIVGAPLSRVPPVAAPWAMAGWENAATHKTITKNSAAIGMFQSSIDPMAESIIGSFCKKSKPRILAPSGHILIRALLARSVSPITEHANGFEYFIN